MEVYCCGADHITNTSTVLLTARVCVGLFTELLPGNALIKSVTVCSFKTLLKSELFARTSKLWIHLKHTPVLMGGGMNIMHQFYKLCAY
jgi:hypothetical protein